MDISDAVAKHLASRSRVSDVKAEIVEETEEEKLVREIMEEPQDEIHVRVTARVHVPIEYISVSLRISGDEA